jgi:cell division protein FtsB
MEIIKVINGKKHVVASNIIKHNQLEDRTDYGCHPIRAIRDLPEKLTQLKDKDAELQAMIEGLDMEGRPDEQARADIETIKGSIQEINTKASNIELSENNGELTFTNYNGESSSFRSGNEVDNSTIQLVNDKIALKKIYTSSEFTGDGTQASPITLVNTPDNSTLTIEDNKYVVNGLKTADGVMTATNITSATTSLQTQISQNKEDIVKVNNANAEQTSKIYDLESRTKGMGGYLNTYNFGKNVTQDALTQYAMQDVGVSDPSEIFNSTKVINSYDKHTWVLTNTPDSTPAVFNWQDLGISQEVQIATDRYAGLVRSSTNEFEGEIDVKGHISVNGLEEKFTDIETNYVKNTDIATGAKAGVVKVNTNAGYGVGILEDGVLRTVSANKGQISSKASNYMPIVPATLDYAIKTGLTTNTIELTAEEQATAQEWLGISMPQFTVIELADGSYSLNITTGA